MWAQGRTTMNVFGEIVREMERRGFPASRRFADTYRYALASLYDSTIFI